LECKNYKRVFNKYSVEEKIKINGKIYTKNIMDKDCKLKHDKIFDKYYLLVVHEVKPKEIKKRKKIVALDPGEKTFMTFYSDKEFGKLGDSMRDKILPIQKKIRKLTSILDKKKNKKGKRLNNRKRIKTNIHKLNLKIKGYVNEVHKKTAKYLCENYENILLPEFETKPLLSNKKRKSEYIRIHKIENKVIAKEELKKVCKLVKLSKSVKYVMQRQSHYTFKKFLKEKAEEYGTKVYDVNEAYTSQACTVCGVLSKTYSYRTKTCEICKYKIDRDVNGSRNILIKSLRELKSAQ
jgi:putative transposase